MASKPNSVSSSTAPETDRSQIILEAARSVFVEHGYHAATLDQVIARSRGSKGTIYEFFGNKEGLFKAVISSYLDEIVEKFSQTKVESKTVRAFLCEAGEFYLQQFLGKRHMDAMRATIGATPQLNSQAATFFEMSGVTMRQWFIKQFKKHDMVEIGPDESHETAVVHFLALCRGRGMLRALLHPEFVPTEPEIRSSVEQAVNVFLRAYPPKDKS